MASVLIRAIKRTKLDSQSYDACIRRSSRSRVYAFSWYLDSVCDQWYALVLGDYDMVMPVPYRRKFGLSYVYLPPLVQQLGVFGENRESYERHFYSTLLSRHLHVDYVFHALHPPKGSVVRTNLILPVDEHDESSLSSNRKRDLKKSTKANLQFVNDISLASFLAASKKSLGQHGLTVDMITGLHESSRQGAQIKCCVVQRGEIALFCLLYAIADNRMYYLLPLQLSEEARNYGAATFAVVELLRLYSSSIDIFDFEGSAIEGVRRFYESFAARNEPYHHLRKTFFHFMKHMR